MIDRRRALAASFDQARQLAGQPISEVTPSRRDFALYVTTHKQDLAVIARLPPGAEAHGGVPQRTAPQWDIGKLVAYARACDDAEVAALAVATGAGGLSVSEVAAIAKATTAPILLDSLTVAPQQLYYARLHGADAALFPAELDANALQELVATASSLHMASVVDVVSETDVAGAVRLPHVIVGLRFTDHTGHLDVGRTLQLAQQLRQRCTLITLPEVGSAAECVSLRGVCDAVMVWNELKQTAGGT